MSTSLEIVNRMVDAVRAGDFDSALALIAPDAVDHSPLVGAPGGHQGWVAKWQDMGARAAEYRTEIVRRIADGDTVATRYAIRTATGEQVGFALDMLRVEDGKVVEHWARPVPAVWPLG
jgi:predicted SnoaL-like aldol condensation-catalyzing enzyme